MTRPLSDDPRSAGRSAPEAARLTYSAPKLAKWGTVEDLTLTGAGATSDNDAAAASMAGG